MKENTKKKKNSDKLLILETVLVKGQTAEKKIGHVKSPLS